jgi:phenylacetate-CoA ligase
MKDGFEKKKNRNELQAHNLRLEIKGVIMIESNLHNPEMETLQGSALEAVQLRKLKKLVVRVYEKSPYYKNKFDVAGVNPYELNSLEEFSHYPFFTKEEERESQQLSLKQYGHPYGMHVTCDVGDINLTSASSGTTGFPTFQAVTEKDRRMRNEHMARALCRLEIKPGDTALFCGEMSMWVAGIPSIDGLLAYGCNVVPVGAKGSIKIAEMMDMVHPVVALGTPSFFRHMIKKVANETNINLCEVGPKKIIVYGEPGGSVPEVVRELSEGFGGAEIYDIMGGTGCHNPLFVSCKENNGLHIVAPENAYVEILDPETQKPLPMEDGVTGEIVLTGLDRECGPLIRSQVKDLVRVFTSPCACGMPGWRMFIEGRVDDMLLVKGVNVFPNAIRDIALKSPAALTGNIQVLKFSKSQVIEPPLEVKVECKGNPSQEDKVKIKKKLEGEIQRVLRFRCEAILIDENKLEIEYGPTGKAKLTKKMY